MTVQVRNWAPRLSPLWTVLFKVGYQGLKFTCSRLGSYKRQLDSRKTSASLTMIKPLTVWITTNCGKFLKRWEYQTTLPVPWKTCEQVMKQQLELDMEKMTDSDMDQMTGSRLRTESYKAIYCHLACFIYMQSTLCKMLGWMNHKLESRFQGKISITTDMPL